MNTTSIGSLTLLYACVIFFDHTPLPRGKHDPKLLFNFTYFEPHIINVILIFHIMFMRFLQGDFFSMPIVYLTIFYPLGLITSNATMNLLVRVL